MRMVWIMIAMILAGFVVVSASLYALYAVQASFMSEADERHYIRENLGGKVHMIETASFDDLIVLQNGESRRILHWRSYESNGISDTILVLYHCDRKSEQSTAKRADLESLREVVKPRDTRYQRLRDLHLRECHYRWS